MTDRDRLILEEPEKMCEYCCNFDKEHIGMDCTALCKLTMTLAYAEDYGGNCMFYNVPKEQIIMPPCDIGQTVYTRYGYSFKIQRIEVLEEKKILFRCGNDGTDDYMAFYDFEIGTDVFLTKKEAEQALKERSGDNA